MLFGFTLQSVGAFDRQYGFELTSVNNLYIDVQDNAGDPLIAQIQINGGLSVDGFYSGSDSYSFATGSAIGVTIEASKVGYTTNQVIVDVNEHGYTHVVITLERSSGLFTCTTIPKSIQGVTVSKPIFGSYLEVVFTSDSPINELDYFVIFTAYPNGSKTSGVPVNSRLVSSSPNSLTYHIDVLDGEFCYTSTISKKQC